MLDLRIFLQGKYGVCPFLKINQTSDKNFLVNLEIAYAPNTADINEIMGIVGVMSQKLQLMNRLATIH